jgi:glycosyltransferase involved in cell wall biosynthesis
VVEKLQGGMTFFSKEAKLDILPFIYQMESELLFSAQGVISVSKYTANKYNIYFNYNRDINIIYNGINIKANFGNGDKTKIRGRVIFTGTLIAKKGIYQLMKAWNIVTESNPNATLYIYGKGPVNKISALLTPQALKTVFFKGHVSREELFRELSKASVSVFPSYAESFALAPLEAMACGVTVINPITTSGPELIEDGINGLLIDPDKPEDIADKILFLLGNEEYNLQLAKAGNECVNTLYNLNKIAQQHIQYYTERLNKKLK